MSMLRKTLSSGLAATLCVLAPGLHPYAAFAQVMNSGAPHGAPAPIYAARASLGQAPVFPVPAAGAIVLPGAAKAAPLTVAPQVRVVAAAVALPAAASVTPDSNPRGTKDADQGRVLFDGTGLEKSPVDVELPAETADKLTSEQRQDVAGYGAVLKNRLFTWKSFPVRLPASVFDKQSGRIVDVKDLFQAPSSDEVRRIGTSDGGRGPRLKGEQREQIKQTATFSVPSEDYPGLSHVWQLGRVLQKGQEAIRETFLGHKAAAAEQVVVNIPDRLWHDQAWSLRRGVSDIGRAFKGLFGLTVGMTEDRPAHSPEAISLEVEKARVESVKSWASNGAPMAIDLGLYDEKLMEAAAPVVKAIAQKADAAWEKNADAVRAEEEAKLKKAGTPADQLAQFVVDHMMRRYNKAFYSALREDASLEALRPGLGALFADHGRARVLVRQGRAIVEGSVREYSVSVQVRLQNEHPVLSRVPRWLDVKVEEATLSYMDKALSDFRQGIPMWLEGAGLKQEGAIAHHDLVFYKTQGAILRETLESQREPNRIFTHRRFIWNPRQWKIEKVEKEGQDPYYTLNRWEYIEVTTRNSAWRLRNMGARFWAWTSNAMYALIAGNLINGPMGYKSLFYAEPFRYDWTVDQKTGQLARTSAAFGTLRSRIVGFYAQRRKVLEDFYSKGDYGLLGRGFRRIMLFFPVDLGLGVVAPVVTAVMQPVLTLANTALSLGLAATAWAWAPAAGVAWWALNAVIFDSEGTDYRRRGGILNRLPRVLPAVQEIAFAVKGAVIALAGIGAAVAAVGAAAGHSVWGALRTGARQAWDFVMRGVISWRGRVPARDEKYIVRRTAGPGLTSEHFFQVSPELLLVAHQAGLEADAVSLYGENAKGLIRMPRRVYDETLAAFEAVTGKSGGYSDKAPAFAEIGAKEKSSLELLSEALKERQELYGRLLSVPSQSRIKLSVASYEATLKKAVLLTRNFYTKFFAEQGLDAEAVKAFWKAKGMAADSWEGLAEAVLAKTFGWEILVPLEQSDKAFKIEVQAPTLGDYAAGLEAGMLPEDLANIELSHVGRGKHDAEPDSRVPKADADTVLTPGAPVN